MPDLAAQSYATHRRYVPLYHFVTPLILLLNLLWTFVGIYHACRGGGRFDRVNSVVQVLVAIALLLIWFYARSFALAVQLDLNADELGPVQVAVFLKPVRVHQPGRVLPRLGVDRGQESEFVGVGSLAHCSAPWSCYRWFAHRCPTLASYSHRWRM